jgi:hypothetical protein
MLPLGVVAMSCAGDLVSFVLQRTKVEWPKKRETPAFCGRPGPIGRMG